MDSKYTASGLILLLLFSAIGFWDIFMDNGSNRPGSMKIFFEGESEYENLTLRVLDTSISDSEGPIDFNVTETEYRFGELDGRRIINYSMVNESVDIRIQMQVSGPKRYQRGVSLAYDDVNFNRENIGARIVASTTERDNRGDLNGEEVEEPEDEESAKGPNSYNIGNSDLPWPKLDIEKVRERVS